MRGGRSDRDVQTVGGFLGQQFTHGAQLTAFVLEGVFEAAGSRMANLGAQFTDGTVYDLQEQIPLLSGEFDVHAASSAPLSDVIIRYR